MALDLTVALVAHPTAPFEKTAPEEEWQRPYAERRKVIVPVEDNESLATALERAAAAIGVTPPAGHYISCFSAAYSKVAFFKPADMEGFADRHVERYLLSELTLVDEGGLAIFGVSDLRTIRYSDLLRASEVGTLDGDPLRPYLIIEPGYGDAPPPDWPTIKEGLAVAWDVLQAIATTGGAVAFGKLVIEAVKKRLARGRDAINANPTWAQRGTRPYQFAQLICMRDWTSAEFAAVLGCAEAEAEGILWVLGFAFDENEGAWRQDGDDPARLIRQILDEIHLASQDLPEDWEATFRRRLIELLETGRPPTAGVTSDFLEEEVTGPYVTPGERIGRWIDSVLEGVRRRLPPR